MTIKITDQHPGSLTPAERLQLATLLIKAGFTVRIGKVKEGSKYVSFVEAESGVSGRWSVTTGETKP